MIDPVLADGLQRAGFELSRPAAGGQSQGAWFATASDGTPVVLKWFPDEGVVDRYAVLLPVLDELRTRGVPVAEYVRVVAFDGWTVSAQTVLPGRAEPNPSPAAVEAIVECISAKAGLGGPLPAPDFEPWGVAMLRTLTTGANGYAMHDSLRLGGRRSARVLERVQSIGEEAEASWFPINGLVHFDLHTDNVLVDDDGALSGIVDWEGASAGDHRFDLVGFAFDLDGHDQPVWDLVEASDIESRVLHAYVAHYVLRFTDWALRFHPEDVTRQLDRAERVLDRYERL